jgi:nardilysin
MATEDVERSLLDKKSYRHWTLSNGLAVLLISDPEVKVDDGNTRKRSRSDDGEEEEDEEEGQDDEDDDDMEGEDDDEDEGEDSDEVEEGEEEPAKKKKHEVQKKAAAAMCVGVGSFLDPPHMQGLSHYLEHMLFMGSTKYPDENEYDDFIQKHGGSSNAFTELEFTNYHFEIQPEALKETLDRFAHFFISPLCLKGSLEREVLAVDSEFQGVVQEDSCRVSQLICHTAMQGHIYQGFSWGNKKSLWDQPRASHVDIRSEILNHYKSHYSAERMSLVVLGGESLDTLASWVTEIFANLPVGKGPRVTFEGSGGPFEGQRLYVMPAVREKHEISITFTLPSLFSHYEKKAEHYISHLVGHEGPGSLLSRLKKEGWANEVCAGVEEDGHSQNTCCYLFSITITLTEAGLEAGPGLGLAVIGLVFEYLDLLRSSGPQEWIWREQKAIHEMKFRYQEEEDAMDFVTKLSSNMHLVSPKHALNSEFVHEEWDPALIQTLLDRMKPQGEAACYRIDLLTKSYDASKKQLEELAGPAIKTELEPWFDLEALSVEVPRSLSLSWSGSRSTTMHLPPVNPYVPSNFELRATPADVEADRRQAVEIQESNQLPALLSTPPVMICDEPGLRVW